MGDNVDISPVKVGEIFDKVFPYALSIGMTPEQYWDKDPYLFGFYMEADNIKKKRQNEQAYLQGLYVYYAIGEYAEILPAFPKKGAKVQPYLKEPFPIYETQAEKEKKEKDKMESIKRKMLMFANKYNIQRRENERN